VLQTTGEKQTEGQAAQTSLRGEVEEKKKKLEESKNLK